VAANTVIICTTKSKSHDLTPFVAAHSKPPDRNRPDHDSNAPSSHLSSGGSSERNLSFVSALQLVESDKAAGPCGFFVWKPTFVCRLALRGTDSILAGGLSHGRLPEHLR